MTFSEQLDLVISRTGHERLRQLCDPAHPDYDPAWPPAISALAERPAPAPTPAPTFPLAHSRIAAGQGPPAAPPPPASAPTLPLAGDLVEALTQRIGADRLARWVGAKLGVDCGCAARRDRLNDLDATLRRFLGVG